MGLSHPNLLLVLFAADHLYWVHKDNGLALDEQARAFQ